MRNLVCDYRVACQRIACTNKGQDPQKHLLNSLLELRKHRVLDERFVGTIDQQWSFESSATFDSHPFNDHREKGTNSVQLETC